MSDQLNLPKQFKGFNLPIVKGDRRTVVKSVLLRAMVQALSDARNKGEELEDKMKMIQYCTNCPICKGYAKEALQKEDGK